MLIEPAAYIPLSGWLPGEAFASGEIEGKNSYIFKLQDDFILKIQYDEEAFSDFTGDILISGVPVAYRFENQILTNILLYYNGFSVEFSLGGDRSSADSPFQTSAERLADSTAAEQEVSRLKNVIDFHLRRCSYTMDGEA